MWSAIFGAEQAQAAYDAAAADAAGSPMGHATASKRGGAPARASLGSPVDTESITSAASPRSAASSPVNRISELSERPSLQFDDDDEEDDDADQSAMTMLLRRLNVLMVKVGEHEFEKKTLVAQMQKERARMQDEVEALERRVHDLTDQTVQLQYQIEYNAEPMLVERLQDATDMRDALTGVKMQLEKELEAKDAVLMEKQEALARVEAALEKLQDEYDEEKWNMAQEREDLEARIALLEADVQRAAQHGEGYSQQVSDLQFMVTERTQQCEALEAQVAAKQEEMDALAQEKMQEVLELAAELRHAEEARQESDDRVAEKEAQLQALKGEWAEQGNATETMLRTRVNELEAQHEEKDARAREMTQVLEDFKHDCMELWTVNEDLKQQNARVTAEVAEKEAQLQQNDADYRQKEFVHQSRITELESEVEKMSEALVKKEQELVQKEGDMIGLREQSDKLVAEATRKAQEAEQEALVAASRSAAHSDDQRWKDNAVRVLTEQVAAAQRELSEAMEMNLQLTNHTTWLEEQNQTLSASVEEQAKQKTSEWENRVQCLTSELVEQRAVVQDQLKQIEDIQAKMMQNDADWQRHNAMVMEEKAQLESNAQSTQDDLEHVRVQLAAVESERAALEAIKHTSEDKVQAAKTEMNEQRETIQGHVFKIEELEAALSRSNDEWQQQIALMTSEKMQLETDFQGTKQELANAQAKLDHLQTERGSLIAQVEALKSGHESAQQNATKMMEVELTQLRAARDELSKEMQNVQNDNALASQKVIALQNESEELRALNTSMQSEIDAFRIAEETVQAQVQAQQSEIQSLNASVQGLGDELHDVKSLNADLEGKCTSLQHELSELQRANATLNEEAAVLRATSSAAVATTEQKATTLQQELQQLRGSVATLETELAGSRTTTAAAEQQNEQLQNEVAHYRALTDGMSVLTAEKESLESDLELAQSALEEVETELQKTKVALSGAQEKYEQISQELMAVKLELEGKADAYEKSSQELEAVKLELEGKADAYGDAEHALTEARAKAERMEQFERQLARADEYIVELTKQVEHLKASEMDLQAQLDTSQHSNAELQRELDAVKAEREVADQELASLQERVTRTESAEVAVAEAKKELQEEVDQLSSTVDAERARVLELEGDLQVLRDEAAPLQSKVESLSAKYVALLAESESAREEAEKNEEQSRSQIDKLRQLLKDTKLEHSKLKESFQEKEMEFSGLRDSSMNETITLKSAVDKLKDEKKRIMPELKQLRVDIEQSRVALEMANAERATLLGDMDKQLKEVNRLQTLVKKLEKSKATIEESTAAAMHEMEEAKNKALTELRDLEEVNCRLEETNQELEATLHKSREFCEELSQRCEDKVREMQDAAHEAHEARAEECAQMALLNGSLRREIEQLAECRYEQERTIEDLRMDLADLHAEKNVLAARAHRLTQELTQYTELPDEDMLADSQSQAPDLWELLSSGMEQLKADLELASKYAASIDGSTTDGPESVDGALAVSS